MLLTRRNTLKAAAATAFTLTAGRAMAATRISQFIWTGAQEPVPRKLAEAYMKAHPDVTIELTAGTNAAMYPKIKASLDISANDPLVNFGFFNLDASAKGRTANVFAPLDKTAVPNVENILDAYRQPDDIGAIFCMDVCGLVYNTDKIKEPPKSWNDLFDPKYKGKVALFDYYWAGNGLVALAKLNGGSEDNIEPGMKIYADAAAAGQFHSLYTSNAQLQQLLVSGEVWIAPYFRGVALPWAAGGAPIGYSVPTEGQVTFPEGFQLVRGGSAEQTRISQEIINLSLAPEAVLDYCKTASVLPLMKNVTLPADLAKDPAVQPEALKSAINLDYAKMAANHTAWSDQWNKRVKVNL
ncbi:ABC transporter substrate-binding protein [Aliirhizobium smilacinae]|uniref:Extracellular solute-binding protein n=1 Tax=Aliirhizobium smilacinae TaxID=1395944 RepID=A0A5C4XJ65_9HYPH|nr:extracellular solute-binding protein [Rhizobium smilacinae]TNM63456.1 extracellular solute-binding protein [Rhizobium smilacinae]